MMADDAHATAAAPPPREIDDQPEGTARRAGPTAQPTRRMTWKPVATIYS